MKTTFTLSVLLAFQVMAHAQESGRVIRMTLDHVSEAAECPATPLSTALEPLCSNDELRIEEQQLNSEITAAQHQLLQKQIARARIKAYMIANLFNQNQLTIKSLVANPLLPSTPFEKSTALHDEALRHIKLAREIREEADAQPTPEAQLASYGNAEEKENLALSLQAEAIRILKAATPLSVKQRGAELLVESPARPVDAQETHTDSWTKLRIQAETLKETAMALKAAAENKQGHEQAVMLEEASALETDYLTARLQLAEAQYREVEKNFHDNRSLIQLYMLGIADESLTAKAQALCAEADHQFRLGKEIREEAKAQPTAAARLAELSNAEEKELLALGKQQQCVRELKQYNRQLLLASR